MIPKLPIKLKDFRGKYYEIRVAASSGGKMGKGNNKSTTIQVIYLLGEKATRGIKVKQVKFTIGNEEERKSAIRKCFNSAIGSKEAEKYFQ